MPWVSAANTAFDLDFGASAAQEPPRPPDFDEDGLPPVVAQNTAAAGTSIPGYLWESLAVSASDAGQPARAGRRCPAPRPIPAWGQTMDTQ
jgi:hypothetical protein